MNDEDWYLLDRAGRRYGPYERAFVESLHQRGELREDTPLWYPGLARWQPAARVLRSRAGGVEVGGQQSEADVSAAAPPAARPTLVGRAAESEREAARPRTSRSTRAPVPGSATPPVRTTSSARPRPGAAPASAARTSAPPATPADGAIPRLARDRVLAAATDLLLVAVLLSLPPLVGTSLQWMPGIGAGRFTWVLVWALADAALLSRVGTTPGRALYALRVTGADGRLLPGSRALLRSALIALTVLGLGAPFFVLVLGFFAWRTISVRGQGWWDLAAGSTVVQAAAAPWRRAFAPLVLILLVFVLLVLQRYPGPMPELPGGFV